MRRLVVELSAEQFKVKGQVVPGPAAILLEKVKSIEMLRILKMVPGEFAAVARIELEDPEFKIDGFLSKQGFQGSKLETELLDKESGTVFT